MDLLALVAEFGAEQVPGGSCRVDVLGDEAHRCLPFAAVTQPNRMVTLSKGVFTILTRPGVPLANR
ncbi:hypothetical protein GCM10010106_21790 [Thermopolyspora flexuosa]|nr:hypothetical protein GCM10010106_21790 [Thermopolyspora flexuosa]